jgi:tetratricopeptide (TPR) repeat protein
MSQITRVLPERADAAEVLVNPAGKGTTRSRAARTRIARGLALTVLIGLLVATYRNAPRDTTLDQARSALGRGEIANALGLALQRLERRPRDREAALIAARCLSTLIYADEAEPYYQIARQGGPLPREALQDRALGLARSNRRDQAVTAYRELLRQFPDDPIALPRLATLLWAWGRADEALDVCRSLIRLRATRVIGYAIEGTIYHDTHQPEQSVVAHERVLQLDPELRGIRIPRALFLGELADDLIAINRLEDARRLLMQAPETDDDVELMDRVAQAHLAAGDHAGAEGWWQRVTARDPNRASAWLQLGRLALRQERTEEAVAALTRAWGLGPKTHETAWLLGAAHGRLGNQAQATRYREEARKIRRAGARTHATERHDSPNLSRTGFPGAR